MLLQHAQAMGLDSAQLESIHASMRAAVANGASPDSVHHLLLATLMHGMGDHASMAGGMQDHLQHMQSMPFDSTQLAAIHACLSSHGAASPPGTGR